MPYNVLSESLRIKNEINDIKGLVIDFGETEVTITIVTDSASAVHSVMSWI